jgi:electron transfer flavoprotein alpha/beta subunit
LTSGSWKALAEPAKVEAKLKPLAVAKLLKTLIAEEAPQLVILGKQAIFGSKPG